MSAAKQVHVLQRKLSAAEQVINELVREVHELKGTLSKVYEQQPKPVTYRPA
jgi:predicted nucleic acid-binding protein